MNLQKIIYITLLTIFMVSCQQAPHRIDNGRVMASVDGRVLNLGEVRVAIPDGVSGADSVAFVDLYVNRWITRQVKAREAERLFSSSVKEIESMVESYRLALLTNKLDQYHIDSSKESPFTDGDVRSYYNTNMSSFRLDKSIVKGHILVMPTKHSDKSKLTTLMKSSVNDKRLDLISLCEKSEDVDFLEFTSSWIEYDEFIAMLPIVRDNTSGKYLKRSGVQTLEDGTHTYLFEFTGYRSAGYVAPLELVETQIRRILTSQYHKDLIMNYDEKLLERAKRDKIVKKYYISGFGEDSSRDDESDDSAVGVK